MPTRWSTIYRMFDSVIYNWEMIVQTLNARKVHLKELNSFTLEELIMFRDFLKPFASATAETKATKKNNNQLGSSMARKDKIAFDPKSNRSRNDHANQKNWLRILDEECERARLHLPRRGSFLESHDEEFENVQRSTKISYMEQSL